MKKIIIFIIFFTFLGLKAIAQPVSLPMHPRSVLVEQRVDDNKKITEDKFKFTTYDFNASSSEKEIIQFYKEILHRQGWTVSKDNPHVFIKKNLKLSIDFYPSLDKNKVAYSIKVLEIANQLDTKGTCTGGGCMKKPPLQHNITAVYPPDAKLLSENILSNNVQSFVYKTKLKPEAVIDFYLKKMPVFGWKLKKQVNNGDYVLDLDKGTCSDCTSLSLQQQQLLLEASQETVNLIFEKMNSSCNIFISPYVYEFSEFREEIASSILTKDNGTIIAINYYENK